MGSKDSSGSDDSAIARTKESIGRYGIWNSALRSDEPRLRGGIAEAAAELDELGFGAIWLGGSSSVEHASIYLTLPNYTNSFLRLGFEEADFTDGGSDRLIDTVFAWGDDDRIRRRIDAFHTAGADHVALQIVNGQGRSALTRPEWRRLAGVLA
ncbi:hypothetical protein QMK19_01810 [Streptomyces sp. H10-C2]|uniref:hypothetical protein n=1 Tax=unclassified Streptomyces TaxID=2593676 RepID=UPI0024BB3350|nr:MULTISPECIES: hypothetical protein [unclassified Streptomyces]MDJ0342107.1 hypothetical protein [Streptomyces sp. PH10-H1]MDJ0368449.1 hypothetical protein [Streptomyces sp. H10-C2]